MGYRETKKPVLYEINTRIWLGELSKKGGKGLSLAEVSQEEIDRIADLGIDLVWLMGVWKTGEKSVEKARTHPDLDKEYRRVLPDLASEDVAGSPYAVADYAVNPKLGGDKALAALRKRLDKKGIGLVLDFVTNHTGLDHDWVTQHPEFYVQGSKEDLKKEPGNYFKVKSASGEKVLAHGRDPYFPGWTDTAQLNFASRSARAAYLGVLESIAGQCDGLRCDMAMLALDEVFGKVWGERALKTAGDPPAQGEFWSEAMEAVRKKHPDFFFLAEVYWGLESRLQGLGFDFTYDKILYDRLLHDEGTSIRDHLQLPLDFQLRSVRFLENHDEARVASSFHRDRHRAAAVIAASVPGMLLLHEGQLDGRTAKVPIQLIRRPEELPDAEIRFFYERLLRTIADPAFRRGTWRLLPVRPAWYGNPTFLNFVAFQWRGEVSSFRLIAVNFGPTQGQCYVDLARTEWEGKEVYLTDLLGEACYTRDGGELSRKGLYLDMPCYGCHLFQVEVSGEAATPKGGTAPSGGGSDLSFASRIGTMEAPKGSGRQKMEIIADKSDDISIVRVKGRVVRENQGELRKALEEIISKRTKGIALDFEAVDYLDSSGLGCCAAIHKLMTDKKCGTLVMFGASPNIQEMWKLIKLDLVIPIFEKERDALDRLKKGSAPASGS